MDEPQIPTANASGEASTMDGPVPAAALSRWSRVATAARNRQTWITILRNPITRILVFIALSLLISAALRWLVPLPRMDPGKELALEGTQLWLRVLRGIVGVALAYWVFVRFVEGRRVAELRPARLLPDAAKGWLFGTIILLLAAAAMAAAGALRIEVAHGGASLLAPLLVLGFAPGITEELVARGIIFRVVEDGFGTWAALAISAIAFGAGHLANPNATLWTSTAIAIEAGLLLGMAYAWTRSLWFCMGLHAAWNFTQGAILGIPVSGFEVKGLLHSTPQGPTLLSGGEFGAEGSLLTVILCTSIAIWMTRKAIAAGRIVRPFWRRSRAQWPASRAGVEEARAAGQAQAASAPATVV